MQVGDKRHLVLPYAFDTNDMQFFLGPIAEQIRQTLRNMAHMLESAESGLNRIVKMTVVLADVGDYDEVNRVWREFFPVDPPARSTCALQLSNGNGVEIECIALAGKSGV